MHQLLNFHNQKLLLQALTHRSYINENSLGNEINDNERLEFLGDAILNFISGEYLYRTNPEMGEDEMTRCRSALVDENQLAGFAIEIGLDLKMRLGQGTIKQGGYKNKNLLSSTFEAIVGGYYLDHNRDIEAVRPLIEELFKSVPKDLFIIRSAIDPKNQLQEFTQAHGIISHPNYVTEKIGGQDHNPEFVCRVYVENKLYGKGRGNRKKEAEKDAANDAINQLKKQGLI